MVVEHKEKVDVVSWWHTNSSDTATAPVLGGYTCKTKDTTDAFFHIEFDTKKRVHSIVFINLNYKFYAMLAKMI
jgi:hypothetical protein